MSPRLEGVREQLQSDFGWVVDLEPGRTVDLTQILYESNDPRLLVIDGQRPGLGLTVDRTCVITDLRTSDDRIEVTLYIGEKPHRFCGPWLVNQVMDIHELLNVYHDAITEKRDESAITVLTEVLQDHESLSRSLLRPLIVPIRQTFYATARLLPGAPALAGARVHMRMLFTRDVR